MSARDDLLRWASNHIELPARKLDFLIVGLPWHEAELLSVTLAELGADNHVDVIAASPPPSSIIFPPLGFKASGRIQVTATWGPQSHCHQISELRSQISSRLGPRVGPRSTVVFDGFGAYAAALNGKLRASQPRHAGVILRTSAAMRETFRRATAPHLPHYSLGQSLEAAILPTEQRLAPVFEKLRLWLDTLAQAPVPTAMLPDQPVLVFGSGRLARLTAEWFRGQAAAVSELPMKPFAARDYYTDLYMDAVSSASIIVVAEIGAESEFLASPTYLRLLRDQTILINLASTAFEFGHDHFSRIKDVVRRSIPRIGLMFDIPRSDGDPRQLFMLGDGHPLLDSLVSTTPPEAIVKAQLMAASELLMDPSAASNCQPSQTVRDLLYAT